MKTGNKTEQLEEIGGGGGEEEMM
jgi:hypothetical protein